MSELIGCWDKEQFAVPVSQFHNEADQVRTDDFIVDIIQRSKTNSPGYSLEW